jgi:hypothetical protein
VYTVVSAALNAGNTEITVAEAIPNATANGTIAPGGTRAIHVKGGGHHIRSNWVESNIVAGDGVAYKFESVQELFLICSNDAAVRQWLVESGVVVDE